MSSQGAAEAASADGSQTHVNGDTAWQHAATRCAWMAGFVLHLFGVPLGLAATIAVFANLPIPIPLRGILILFVIVPGIFAIVFQVPRVKRMLRLRRILRTYPWQVYEGGLTHGVGQRYSAQGDRPWFEVPDPDNGDSYVRVYLFSERRTRWWSERMSPQAGPEAKADIQTLWFVGDPRFCAILGVPGKCGPYRLLEFPRQGCAQGQHSDEASSEALTRAFKAGANVRELDLPAIDPARIPVAPAPAPPPGPAWSFPATRRSMRLLLLRAAVVPVVALIPLFLYLAALFEDGPNGMLSGKSIAFLVAVVLVACQRLWTRLTLRRKLRSDGRPWRTLNVEIRHRRGAVVLVTGNEALRTQFLFRRPPAGRAQVWFEGHIHGDGVVSLRANGAVVPVRCTEKGGPRRKAQAAASAERPRTRRRRQGRIS